MFVSANAVNHFFASKPQLASVAAGCVAINKEAFFNRLPLCLATGPGTALALAAVGVPPDGVLAPADQAGQFDSEALWQRLAGQNWAGKSVLIVRGSDPEGQNTGRDWLASQWQQAGATVDVVLAYLRSVPQFSPQEQAQMREAAHDGSVWLFSSSQAIAHLLLQIPGQDWSQARALATHPRIAQAAREAGFGVVCASRPGLDDVAITLKSLHA